MKYPSKFLAIVLIFSLVTPSFAQSPSQNIAVKNPTLQKTTENPPANETGKDKKKLIFRTPYGIPDNGLDYSKIDDFVKQKPISQELKDYLKELYEQGSITFLEMVQYVKKFGVLFSSSENSSTEKKKTETASLQESLKVLKPTVNPTDNMASKPMQDARLKLDFLQKELDAKKAEEEKRQKELEELPDYQPEAPAPFVVVPEIQKFPTDNTATALQRTEELLNGPSKTTDPYLQDYFKYFPVKPAVKIKDLVIEDPDPGRRYLRIRAKFKTYKTKIREDFSKLYVVDEFNRIKVDSNGQPIMKPQSLSQLRSIDIDPYVRDSTGSVLFGQNGKAILREPKTIEIEKPYLYKGEPLVQFMLCPYVFNDLGVVSEEGECESINGDQYYSMHTLGAARRDVEIKKTTLKVLGMVVVFAGTAYLGTIALSTIALRAGWATRLGTVESVAASATTSSIMWVASRAIIWDILFSIPIFHETHRWFRATRKVTIKPERERLSLLSKELQYFKYDENWTDTGAPLILKDTDETMYDFRNLFYWMIEKTNFKRHDEICEDCWIGCTPRNKVQEYIATTSGPMKVAPLDEFDICDE